MTMISDL